MDKNPLIMKCLAVGIIFLFVGTYSNPAIAHSVVTGDVIITINGGFGCTVSIQNNGNYTINSSISIISYRIFREGSTNITGNGSIKPGCSMSVTSLPPGIDSIYAMAQAGNQTLVRKGISIFYIVILFR